MRGTIDGNEAAVDVAYRLTELCAIYPITPSSTMAELADDWASARRTNIWGTIPTVMEMQSEAGAAGAMHGALQGGALSTTYTASQGLLLMIPNMYKIAGELTSTVFHVAARSLAAQGLSIFGDHADVMAVRQTGFALLSSASVQEAHDFALIAQAATMRSRVPFLHFFDGFRTSHEVTTMERLTDDDLRALVPEELVREHRARALTPERPFIRGTAQNPDVYFQARETVNPYYAKVGGIVQEAMDALAERTGRAYRLVEYSGHPEATRVVVIMGSGGVTARETVASLAAAGERVGVLQVRLYRPFPAAELVAALPPTVEAIAVLDRTKEPGSNGEPLFLDVRHHPERGPRPGDLESMPRVIGGRYGLSSKEFTPGMVAGIFAELATESPRPRFTVGITDDVGGISLDYDPNLDIEDPATLRAVFYGIGSDGTVGANKNTVKILAEDPQVHAQAYFVYDSKKSGGLTVSHLRFGPHAIAAPVAGEQGRFRRHPRLHPAGQGGRPVHRPGRRDAAAQRAAAARAGVGRAARADPAGDRRAPAAAVRHRRRYRRPRGGPARTDQHRPAGRLLRHLRGAAARRGAGTGQGDDPQDLRPARPGGGAAQRGGGRQHGGGAGRDPGPGHRRHRARAAQGRAG